MGHIRASLTVSILKVGQKRSLPLVRRLGNICVNWSSSAHARTWNLLEFVVVVMCGTQLLNDSQVLLLIKSFTFVDLYVCHWTRLLCSIYTCVVCDEEIELDVAQIR